MTDAGSAWPQGGGEAGELIRSHDWAATPLGSIESWPPELRTTVDLLVAHAFPMVLLWGPELTQLYNDGYREIMGDKHPAGLGRPTRESWPEVWDFNAPLYQRVLAGETVTLTDQLFPIERRGALEQAYFSLCYSPARDGEGRVRGIFIVVYETTGRIRHEAEQESRYRSLFDAMDEGYLLGDVLFDESGQAADILYVEANPAAVRMIGGNPAGARLRQLSPDYEDYWYEIWGRVARTGSGERLERYAAPERRWYGFYVFKPEPENRASSRVAVIFQDITERKRIEERHSFLLNLSDALRPLSDPIAIEGEACRLLAEHLGTSRAYYFEYGEDQASAVVRQDFVRGGLSSLAGKYPACVFSDIVPLFERGRALVIPDARASEGLAKASAPASAASGALAFVSVPLVKRDKLVGTLTVAQAQPRAWQEAEVRLVEETAERMWEANERGRAATALRESAGRLQLVLDNALDYAIFTTDPEGLIDQWHKGAEAVFGWSAEEAAGMSVDCTFTAQDREHRQPQLERETAASDGRAPNVRWHARKDGSLVFIDGFSTALRSADGALTGFLKIGQDVTERRRAEEHQRMLLAELQHRVRNTLAVVRSVARRTAETSDSVEELASHFEGRLDAFSRVQAMVTRNPEAGIDFTGLIEDELLAHAEREGERLIIEGPEISLKARPAETLSLAIHELATNAVKYGALSGDGGRVAVRWRREGSNGAERLLFAWEESGLEGVDTAPEREGFGMELLTRTLPYELRAEAQVEFRPQGMRFTLAMPLGPEVLGS